MLFAMCALLPAAPGAARQGAIHGRITDRDGNAPVAGVAVTVRGSERFVTTNTNGAFSFADLRPGLYWLDFRMLGYADRTDSVRITNESLDLAVTLARRPVDLEPIEVTPRVGRITTWLAERGFSRRGMDGSALLHATGGQLRHKAARNLDALLRATKGVRVRRLADGGGEIRLEPSPQADGEPCIVTVYLNGSVVEFGRLNALDMGKRQSASRAMRFDDLLRIDDIDGIELYGPDDSPVAAGCGALLLWSDPLRPTIDETFSGIVKGVAVDTGTGAPLVNVRIRLVPGDASTLTDSRGQFEFPDVTPGDYEIEAVVDGRSPWNYGITVKAYGTTSVEIRLDPDPTRARRPLNT
jgi:Carboxypeptidase regulatory-like domain